MSTTPLRPRALAIVRRALWPLLFAIVALGVAWFRLGAPLRVEVVRVDRGTVVQEAFGRGTIESQREAAVGFDLVGRLSEVLVDEGARVTLGQALARLETNQAAADLRSAQTGISAARASLQRIAADEERARAMLGTAERDVARAQTLFAGGVIPTQQRDEATDHLRVARADLDRVLAQRSEATRGIDVAAGGAEQRRVTMVRATLLAPFDGLVTRRLRDPGDTVTSGSTVLRVVDTSRVYVSAAIDETVLPMLATEQKSMIFFPGKAPPESGRVTRIGWEADRQTHELLVDVTPDRTDRRVAIGQRADVRIEVGRKENVVRAPVRMIQRDDKGPFFYVDRGGKIAIVRPTFGISGDDQVEILEGIAEGDSLLQDVRVGGVLAVGRRWAPAVPK